MNKRKMIGTVIGALAIGVAALPLAAFAAADTSGLMSFSLQGVGIGALAAGDCSSPPIACKALDTCECLTGAETVVGTKDFNKGSLTFELSIDQTSSFLPISTVGDCLPATGFGTIASSNGKSTILIDVSGLACPTSDGLAEVFNGTYNVTTGTGKKAFTNGTGAINGSLTGTVSRASINGNVQP
jgi:hypothetical protein